mgnify:CR=1 FL=1
MDRATARKNTHKQQEKPSDVRCHGLGALCCLRFCWRYHFRGVTKMYASEQHAGDAAGMVWQLKCCARRVLHGQRVWDAAQQVLARQGALYIQRHCLQHLWWYHGALLAEALKKKSIRREYRYKCCVPSLPFQHQSFPMPLVFRYELSQHKYPKGQQPPNMLSAIDESLH